MTSRERQASGGVTLAARPAAAPARAASLAPENVPPWEELFRCLSPASQEELLTLAARQGLLHAHQLPTPDPFLLQQRRQMFANLLSGKTRELTPAPSVAVPLLDAALDASQAEAAARAINSPDVCLIQGLPGSGKSRVAAEVVAQAAARGERVLLVSASTAGLDRVLEQAGRRDSLYPIRYPHPGEKLDSLAACIRPFLPEERARSIQETTVQNARASAEAAETQFRRRQDERQVWDRLVALSAVHAALEARSTAIETRRATLAQEAERSCEALEKLTREREAERQRQMKDRTGIQEQRESIQRDRLPLTAERDALRPFAEALRRGCWWTLPYWKARTRGGVLQRDAELEQRLAELDQKTAALSVQGEELDRECSATESRFEEQRRELIARNTARLQEALDREVTGLQCERDDLQRQWDESCRSLQSARPEEFAVETARASWERLLEQDERQANFLRRWASTAEEAAPVLANRLLHCANLVAATPASLAAESAAQNFDLLVVEEPEQISEADLTQVARRARRWVLIGEPEPPLPATSNRVVPHRPGVFHRLWQHLHSTPRQLPFRWFRTESRLCCRLRPTSDDQRPWIHSEPVVDCPDIELFILAAPRQEPQLVEVRFPLTMPIREAKTFILRELQEVAAHARGPAFLWTNTADAVLVQTGDLPPETWQAHERIELEPGVCEIVRSGDDSAVFETLGFEFGAGWTRSRSETWLASHLGVRDLGRTAYLGRLHRPGAGLESFLAMLFRLSLPGSRNGEQVHFVAVPDGGQRRTAKPALPPRGGAGFEADLAHAASAERLPQELRSALPRQGMINQPEAAALVRALETLVADSSFRNESAAWQKGRLPAGCAALDAREACQGSAATHTPAIAVTALYDAQVRLLRLLVSASPILARAGLVRLGEGHFRIGGPEPLDILVEAPPALRQRECLALLLSLTRSHSHRAVAFGEQAQWLALALTRACSRLLLFGDPGTLVRRTQWQGAVDHLDETAGERERELIACLLRHMPDGAQLASAGEPVKR